MSTVAEQLRSAREARKLTILQVAETTKIRTDLIRALEEGDFNLFSAPIYIRGSVKNYATLLKLDVPQVMAVLDAELGRTEKFSEPPPLTEASNTPIDRLMFLLSKFTWRSDWPAARSWLFYWSLCLWSWSDGILGIAIPWPVCRPLFINPRIPQTHCRWRRIGKISSRGSEERK